MSLKNVEVALADHAEEVSIEATSDCIIVRKTRYDPTPKGKETWSQINDIVQNDLGGKWVSLGKESHWVIPFEDKPSKTENKGNNGTYGTLHCPYCGKTIDVTFKPRKES